jgi:hypothetical protein
MTPQARLRKAERIVRQLRAIEQRTDIEQGELAWWEKRVGMLEQRTKQSRYGPLQRIGRTPAVG